MILGIDTSSAIASVALVEGGKIVGEESVSDLGRGNHAEAEPLLRSGYQGMFQRQSSIPVENRSTLDEVKGWIDLLPPSSNNYRVRDDCRAYGVDGASYMRL